MVRTRAITAVFLMFAAGGMVAGQRPARNGSASDGIAADRLSRLDKVFQQHVDENRVGGVVALVLRDGRPIYEKAFGWSDKEAGRRMSVDTIFRIASQTKALTSVAILRSWGGAPHAHDAGEPVHPGLREDDRRGEGGQRRDDGAGAAGDHHPRPAHAHRGHLVWHRRAGVVAVRSQRPRAGGGIRLVHR